MTPESQRLALAKWAGWTNIDAVPSRPWGTPPPREPNIFSPLPDFLNDLNAVHELVLKLPAGHKRCSYPMHLRQIVIRDATENMIDLDSNMVCDCFFYEATAAQRCEALLRTLGLWEE